MTDSCPACFERVPPRLRNCPHCDDAVVEDVVPPETEDAHRLTQELSEKTAANDGVTFDVLRSTHDAYDRPLGDYLFESERPEAVFESSKATLEDRSGETWRLDPGFLRTGHLVVTDERLFFVSPNEGRDQVLSVEFEDVLTVDAESTWRTEKVVLTLTDGFICTLVLDGASADQRRELVEAIDARREQSQSADGRPASVRSDADDAVARADDAESAFAALASVFEDRDESVFDRAAAEAETVDELLSALTAVSGTGPDSPEPSLERRKRQSKELVSKNRAALSKLKDDLRDTARSATSVGSADDSDDEESPAIRTRQLGILVSEDEPALSKLRTNVKDTARNARPGDVGRYAIGAGIMGAGVAVSAPVSTAVVLGGIAAGGVVTGAYASAHPDSVVAKIDPLEMAVNVKALERRGKASAVPNGASFGAALGAADYVGSKTVPQEYARWLANADTDLILRGADFGARTAENSPDFTNSTTTAMLGGGFGLLYGYAKRTDDLDELTRLLDDDLSENLLAVEGEGDESSAVDVVENESVSETDVVEDE